MKIIFKKRKHGIVYHRIGYCCGKDKYFPQFLLFLIFAFKKQYYWRCPICGRLHCMELSWHTVSVHDNHVKQVNKKYNESKKELWKHG